jgi:hypothetical protein
VLLEGLFHQAHAVSHGDETRDVGFRKQKDHE